MESQLASQSRFFFGDAAGRIDLTPELVNFVITAQPVVVQTRKATGEGKLAMTADAVMVTHTATAQVYRSAATEPLLTEELEGILLVAELDTMRAEAFPALVTAAPSTFPTQDGSMLNLTFTERNTTGYVEGALVTDGNLAVPGGSVGYRTLPNGITMGAGAVAADNYGVAGVPLTAEGIS